jgi:transcriptional regulator with XRE-family HTH domain
MKKIQTKKINQKLVLEFTQWLNNEKAKRGWTDYRLSAEAHISTSVLSNIKNGRLPKWDACKSIAGALGVSPISIFRKAGLLPPAIEGNTVLEPIMHHVIQLTDDEREELIAYIALLFELRKIREKRKKRRATKDE